MGFNIEDSSCHNSSMEKHIGSLRKSVQKTKHAIAGKLKKSEHRFKEEVNNCEEEVKKTFLLKKLDKISKELQILDNLSEDEIVKFALTTHHNMMTVASNRRFPETVRMKARVASHKPLSLHLTRIKSKLKEETESEEEEDPEPPVKSLNKMSVNNQIVKMKKVVKRSKVHIIHKLTRNIKILRGAKGKNKEKCEKKADRLVKKLQCIKELPEDDISRFVLTTTQDLAKLSTDINAPLKNQAMATIAVHKFVADAVTQFKNTYPDLHKNILTVLKKNKKKRKLITEETESERQLGKLQNKKFKGNVMSSDSKTSSSEENESCEEENDEEGSNEKEVTGSERQLGKLQNKKIKGNVMNIDSKTSSSEEKESGEEGSDEEESNEEGTESEQQLSKLQNKKIKGNIKNNDSDTSYSEKEESGEETSVSEESNDEESGQHKNESEQTSEESEVEEETQNSNIHEEEEESDFSKKFPNDTDNDEMSNDESNKLTKIKKNNSTKKFIHIKDIKLPKPLMKNKSGKETDKIDNSSTKHKQFKKSKSITPKVVDPFFVTSTNEDYVTSQVPSIGESDDTNWKVRNNDFEPRGSNKMYKNNRDWNSRKDFREPSSFGMKHYKKPSFNLPYEGSKFNKNLSTNFNFIGNRKERRKALQQPVKEEKTEKLHPSWEAKKKLSSIANFQGKKITFD